MIFPWCYPLKGNSPGPSFLTAQNLVVVRIDQSILTALKPYSHTPPTAPKIVAFPYECQRFWIPGKETHCSVITFHSTGHENISNTIVLGSPERKNADSTMVLKGFYQKTLTVQWF